MVFMTELDEGKYQKKNNTDYFTVMPHLKPGKTTLYHDIARCKISDDLNK